MGKVLVLMGAALLIGCGNMPESQKGAEASMNRIVTEDGYVCYVYTPVSGAAIDCVPLTDRPTQEDGDG